MVHLLTTTKFLLEIVVPLQDDAQRTCSATDLMARTPRKSTEHHDFIVTFSGNVDSCSPGATPVIRFGRTLQTECGFDGVKCSLADVEPLETCPAEKYFKPFYESIILDEKMLDEFEFAIRGDDVILLRLKGIP